MARKPNYDQDKRRKEQERKARKDAKRAERQQRREGQTEPGTGEDGLPADGDQATLPPTD